MRGFGRLLYSEIKRLRHTSLLYLHIAVPAAGTAAFLWYYSLAGWESRSEVLVYFQTVACVWPFFCGMICGLSAEMEEALGYQNFFLLPGRRFHALLAKWIVLLGLGLLGLGRGPGSGRLVLGGFGSGLLGLGSRFVVALDA